MTEDSIDASDAALTRCRDDHGANSDRPWHARPSGMIRIAETLRDCIPSTSLVSLEDAGHFTFSTHAARHPSLIAEQVMAA
jgi:hypothetical protein